MLDAINAIPEAEVLGPKVQQVLLNAVVSLLKPSKSIRIHDTERQLEGLLQPNEFFF